MRFKSKWIWLIYFCIMMSFAIQKIVILVTPSDPSFLYYYMLRSFSPIFYIDYIAHVINIFLFAIHCIPLFLYIHRIQFLHPEVWRYLFVLKCIFEIIGHSYKLNYLTSLYHLSPRLVFFVLIIAILPYIPLYVLCYRYAFEQDTYFQVAKSE